MLVLFWLPILLGESVPRVCVDALTEVNPVSLLWAFHSGIRFAIHALKTSLSVKAGVRA